MEPDDTEAHTYFPRCITGFSQASRSVSGQVFARLW